MKPWSEYFFHYSLAKIIYTGHIPWWNINKNTLEYVFHDERVHELVE